MFLKEEKLQMKHILNTAWKPAWYLAFAITATCTGSDVLRAQTPASEGETLILRAYDLSGAAESDGQYTEVIELCRQAAKQGLSVELVRYNNRLRSWAHNRRGETRQIAGQSNAAAADFEIAVGLAPNSWRALHNRALSSASKRQWTRALADLDKVLKLKNEFAEVYFHRAEVRREMEHFSKARSDYDIYIDSRPKDAEAYAGRGSVLFQLGKRKSAVADLYNALKIDPLNVSALIYRGEAFTQLGYYDKAARDFRKAIQLEPNSGRAYRSAAWLMATCPDKKIQNDQLAMEAAKKSIELVGKPSFWELDTLAAAQASSGDFDAAKQTLTHAMKLASNVQRKTLATRLMLYQQSKPYRLSSENKPANAAGGAVNVVSGEVDGPALR
jgi:tetratricopeptide (TPR) repeat protein